MFNSERFAQSKLNKWVMIVLAAVALTLAIVLFLLIPFTSTAHAQSSPAPISDFVITHYKVNGRPWTRILDKRLETVCYDNHSAGGNSCVKL